MGLLKRAAVPSSTKKCIDSNRASDFDFILTLYFLHNFKMYALEQLNFFAMSPKDLF